MHTSLLSCLILREEWLPKNRPDAFQLRQVMLSLPVMRRRGWLKTTPSRARRTSLTLTATEITALKELKLKYAISPLLLTSHLTHTRPRHEGSHRLLGAPHLNAHTPHDGKRRREEPLPPLTGRRRELSWSTNRMMGKIALTPLENIVSLNCKRCYFLSSMNFSSLDRRKLPLRKMLHRTLLKSRRIYSRTSKSKIRMANQS